ncbi:hypothetical protein [Anaerolinea sp.]|uniref:hypothetical protein n=1 Tax=Anaerolinea sp. TaxID=1872519 RepID=UPI002ACDB67E|nr:hypothetical protein [Anaerolinea sp.]
MSERMVRAQLLLQPDLHRRLRKIAEQENRSISDVTRDLLEIALNQREKLQATKLERVRALQQIAERILQERVGKPLEIDVAQLIVEEREERTREIGSD